MFPPIPGRDRQKPSDHTHKDQFYTDGTRYALWAGVEGRHILAQCKVIFAVIGGHLMMDRPPWEAAPRVGLRCRETDGAIGSKRPQRLL